MPSNELANLRMLVVDDDRATRALLMSLLQELGVPDVRQAASGREALDQVHHEPPDLILCDLLMENLDGIEFTRRLRTSPSSPHSTTPVILITGHADRQTVLEARDAGVNAFLAKPVSMNELKRKVLLVKADPRKFIWSDDFVGPDRRRREQPLGGRPDRRRTE